MRDWETRTMIEKFSKINNFGVFDAFDWNAKCRDDNDQVAVFRKLNIIYGRNYSGKTTLSRLLRSFEKGGLPERFEDAEFEISHDGMGDMNHRNLQSHPYTIRVYNKDFISEHLKWLKDESGEIKAFAVLGEKNVEIENQIEEKKRQLGSEEQKTGLLHKLAENVSEYQEKKSQRDVACNSLDEKLRNKANNDIKHHSAIYGDVNYNITKIKSDIATLENSTKRLLSEEQIQTYKTLLKEEAKEDSPKVNIGKMNFASLIEQTQELLGREIKPTKPIQELLNDAVLQKWVEEGIGLHKGKRTTCSFCQSTLPENLWSRLDAHFSKESIELKTAIQEQVKIIEDNEKALNDIKLPNKSSFYSSLHKDYETWQQTFDIELATCRTVLDSLKKTLLSREQNIFKKQKVPEFGTVHPKISKIQNEINMLIDKNNKKTTTLKQEQYEARLNLRLNEIAKFIQEIDYDSEKIRIGRLNEDTVKSKKNYDDILAKTKAVQEEILVLRTSLQDERKGAEKVNEYLSHFFGHDQLSLKAIEDDCGKYKFQITRGEFPAYNLSEGECSLVAFCYFMAKLDDAETKGQKPIIWIDDPVSSLDNNHIFFVFSLIESIITKPIKDHNGKNNYKYQQLFVSTHNLDFLKYLKQLHIPSKKIDGEGNKKKCHDCEYFVIERVGKHSKITIMPHYLKDYVTEFNYLFHQIYKCSEADISKHGHECFYNFGNNLRKFLEAFLFYKYPVKYNNEKSTHKLKMFFGDENSSTALANRISNELSHLEEVFDRSMRPIDIPEIPRLAKYVIEKMKEKDKEQYDALMESIGENAV